MFRKFIIEELPLQKVFQAFRLDITVGNVTYLLRGKRYVKKKNKRKGMKKMGKFDCST